MSIEATAYSEVIHRAMDFAASVHEGQYRKNRDEKIPYFAHCAMVGRILEGGGFEEEVVAAGILHDTLEDSAVSMETLVERFGKGVANLVEYVSEKDKSLPWEERKARYLEGLQEAPQEALAISCADKIHNMWSLILYHRSGRKAWEFMKQDRKKQIGRLEALATLLRERFDHPLRKAFEKVLDILKEEC